MVSPEIKKILDKYGRKLESNIDDFDRRIGTESYEYGVFKEEEYLGELSFYEKFCNFSENLIKVVPSKRDLPKLNKSIRVKHLRITANGAAAASVVTMLSFVFLAILIGGLSFFLLGSFNILLVFLMIFASLISFFLLRNYPNYLANKWRLRASNQMVLCILYVAMYMRHTSNLEHAIRFAANHIGDPLNFDLRKVFWDVEGGKFSTIKESLDYYLETWRGWNNEFIESFNLIEGSLFEPVEERRLEVLDKALEVMLESTYERMLHYAHDLKGPVTMLHMLGVILPVLGLVIFPLITSFLGGLVKWWYLLFLYNIFLPILVYAFGVSLLGQRPTGYGETDVTDIYKELKNVEINLFGKIVYVNPIWFGISFGLFILLIAFSPVILHTLNPQNSFINTFFGYECSGKCIGPFGVNALFFSLLIPLGLAFGLGTYYKLSTKKGIVIRNYTKDLEKEFASAIFQLGNRVGDGLPVELAFRRVADNMPDSPSGKFFYTIDANIRVKGMDVERAIFDDKMGAINYFPSNIIESSMRVLVESARKGPLIVSRAMNSISTYIRNLHKIEERLKDLLADILSSMQSQILFLTPAIAGIVIGIASMVTNVLKKLGETIATKGVEEGAGGFGGLNMASLPFGDLSEMIPPYFFQLVVGVYVVQIIFILTVLSVRIQNGEDDLGVENSLGKNLFRSTLLYVIIALVVILMFQGLSSAIVGGFE